MASKTQADYYDDERDHAPPPQKPRAPFALVAAKVVRELIEPEAGGTATIGDLVDDYIRRAATEGTELQEVKIVFRDDGAEWNQIAEQYRTR